ncbi:MAG: hypothetical protein AB7O44_20910 [Hyphomicrobiaceae bacterium]
MLAVVMMIVPVRTVMMMPAVMAVVLMSPAMMVVTAVRIMVMAMPPMVVTVVVTPPARMHLLDQAGRLRNADVHGAGRRCGGRSLGCRRKTEEGQCGQWK